MAGNVIGSRLGIDGVGFIDTSVPAGKVVNMIGEWRATPPNEPLESYIFIGMLKHAANHIVKPDKIVSITPLYDDDMTLYEGTGSSGRVSGILPR